MKRLVAVEDELSNVVQELKNRGYQVVSMDDPRWRDAEAVIVRGTDKNFLGMHEPSGGFPVIDASGLTAQEVVRAVEDRLGIRKADPRYGGTRAGGEPDRDLGGGFRGSTPDADV